ncbi:MAG: topoisomerase C-terminal repeat-containing protein, partial [Patescibacteria group bacterium]
RYGAYVTDGKTNASLGKNYQQETLTREDAIALLDAKRKAPPSKRFPKKEPKEKSITKKTSSK